MFRFQQFEVLQHQTAMKICTDSLLFGAMAPVKDGDKVLDIGTGTGLLALIAAQLGAVQITAVEYSTQAYQEAVSNFAKSPWADRLQVINGDIRHFSKPECSYDLLICNPPFFDKHSKSSDAMRRLARHTEQLSNTDLLLIINRLMSENSLFYVLLPIHGVDKFNELALQLGLHLHSKTDIQGRAGLKPKVSALVYGRKAINYNYTTLTVYTSNNVYTDMAAKYLSPFLLRFGEANGVE